jgi:hypothetical protein
MSKDYRKGDHKMSYPREAGENGAENLGEAQGLCLSSEKHSTRDKGLNWGVGVVEESL